MRKRTISVLAALTIIGFLTAPILAAPPLYTQSFTVSPLQKYTLFLNLHPGNHVSGSISVTGGLNNDINFQIIGPYGGVIINDGRVSGGTDFDFTATSDGVYTMIFDNSFSILSPKTIVLNCNFQPSYIPATPIVTSLSFILATGTSIVLSLILALIIIILVVAAVERGKAERKAAAGPRIYCHRCGAENSINSIFCRSCGAKMQRPENL